MKKVLFVVGVIFTNLILITISLLIRYKWTDKILRATDVADDVEILIVILITVASLVFFYSYKKYIKFGMGLITISVSSIIFLFFYFNKNLSSKSNYVTFNVHSIFSTSSGVYFSIDNNNYNGSHSTIKVGLENYLVVDSVQIRVDNGLFGFPVLTNDLRIIENNHCENIENISSNSSDYFSSIAEDFAIKRCFTLAIEYYSKSIKLDDLNDRLYRKRGLLYVVKKKYRKAILDFLKATQLQNKEIKDENNDSTDNTVLVFAKKIKEKNTLSAEDFKELSESISLISDANTDKYFIRFCLKKIQEKQ